ncbi:G1/S-specific cyclin-D3 [Portunus trituberculatus]|uniref:G1/S-specific cyclin-D3 n=1 Tax=Portunus trituberculatus TaxID=210409 RepID=A0A5B7DEB0_PORTR|nr:G1/S-specific cyclin-D3 [Portunus trituberculatus]
MEDLYCSEAPACSEGPIALQDNTLLEDSRILNNLLQLQPFTIPPQNYFLHIQSDIQPYMRKVVTKWMWEVCEEEGCEEQVFAVAINLFDRFLCACVIQRTQLQLLGSVCLLLASKLRQCRPLSVDNLTFYTDYSVSQQEIRHDGGNNTDKLVGWKAEDGRSHARSGRRYMAHLGISCLLNVCEESPASGNADLDGTGCAAITPKTRLGGVTSDPPGGLKPPWVGFPMTVRLCEVCTDRPNYPY